MPSMKMATGGSTVESMSALPMPRMKTAAELENPLMSDTITLGALTWRSVMSVANTRSRLSPVSAVTATGVCCSGSSRFRAVTKISSMAAVRSSATTKPGVAGSNRHTSVNRREGPP